MTPEALINELAAKGVVLKVADGTITYRAPKGALTPELRQEVRRRKAEIIAFLGGGLLLAEPGECLCQWNESRLGGTCAYGHSGVETAGLRPIPA